MSENIRTARPGQAVQSGMVKDSAADVAASYMLSYPIRNIFQEWYLEASTRRLILIHAFQLLQDDSTEICRIFG